LDHAAREFEQLLESGRGGADTKAAAFCENLLDLSPAVWRLVVTEGIEPTNNHAERLLRRGVLWRKHAFGCQSAEGCRFVERILTAVQTLRLQGRPVLRYLHDRHTRPDLVAPAWDWVASRCACKQLARTPTCGSRRILS
jgi:hypothetical protein